MHSSTLFGFADELHKIAYVLSEKKRDSLPKSDFVQPKSEGYPIPDRQHARAALGLVAMHHPGSSTEAAVKAKVEKKFPGMEKTDCAK